jgi:predicted glutamine amidotransferase
MCVAIFKPAGKHVSKADMKLAHAQNKDGSGFAIRHSKGIYIEKGLWSFAEFWDRYARYQEYEPLIHFRWSTGGGVTEAMCHPFPVGNGAVIHNGHLHGYGSSTQSDTAEWCTSVLGPLLATMPTLLTTPAFQRMLADSIGTRNKLAIMLPDMPTVLIGNGKTEQGIWYSNLDYRHVVRWTDKPLSTPSMPAAACYTSEESELDLWEREEDYDTTACDNCGHGVADYQICMACLSSLEDTQVWNDQTGR